MLLQRNFTIADEISYSPRDMDANASSAASDTNADITLPGERERKRKKFIRIMEATRRASAKYLRKVSHLFCVHVRYLLYTFYLRNTYYVTLL